VALCGMYESQNKDGSRHRVEDTFGVKSSNYNYVKGKLLLMLQQQSKVKTTDEIKIIIMHTVYISNRMVA
jgi:hypothetical protein